VAILSQGSNEARPVFTAFRAELRERGYIEGGTIAIEFHLAHGSTERLAPLAQAIARDRPEVVLADGGEAASAMHTATREIPIVAIGGIDPRQRVLVESLARPGGNVTGITTFTNELPVKQLELLIEIAPMARRIGAVGTQGAQQRHVIEEAAASRGLGLRFIYGTTVADVARELAPAALADVAGLVLAQNPVLSAMSALVVAQNQCRPEAGGLRRARIHRCRWPCDLWHRLRHGVPPPRRLRGSHPAWRESGRDADRAPRAGGIGGQSPHGPHAGYCDPPERARARRRGD
jgi:ABC-type uncharacterized transport system substrate-binding protein